MTRLATPVFDTTPIHYTPPTTDKFSDKLLIYVNLYQHAKNQAISMRDMVDLKILQSDWLRIF